MNRSSAHLLVISGLLLLPLLGGAQEIRPHAHPPPQLASHRSSIWHPPLKTSWQWQLTTPVDEKVKAQMYDIDMFDNDASVVGSLHNKGRKVVCYIDVGTWERWRPDAKKFPKSVLGKPNGWPGERWLDIRRIDILGPIMKARMDLRQAKGFDGMEPDNVDGYANDTGFPLTYEDQIRYNSFVAKAAHTRGISVALKNDLDQITDLLPSFDWALDEQCFQYSECGKLLPFIKAGKAVFEVEYFMRPSKFCPEANSLDFNSMKKHLALGVYRVPCR
jgi:hypothetical protein